MGYMTLGADGRVRPDDATLFARGFLAPLEVETRAQEIFPGAVEIGKRKKKKGFLKKRIAFHKKILKKIVKVHPLTAGPMFLKKMLAKRKAAKKAKRARDIEETEESPEAEDIAPVSEMISPSGETVEHRSEAEAPARDIQHEPPEPAPPLVEERTPVRAATVEERIEEEVRPEEEAPRGVPVEAEPEEVPESNLEGNTVGGWLVTRASPTQHDYGYRRRWEKSLVRGRGARVPQAYKPPRSRYVPPTWASAFERQGAKVKGVRLPFEPRGRGFGFRRAPGLSGLGQEAPDKEAMEAYALSVRDLQGAEKWLSEITVTRWEQGVKTVKRRAQAEMDYLRSYVLGRIDSDTEEKIFQSWFSIWKRANEMEENPPSWLTRAGAAVSEFLGHFKKALADTWRSYVTWATERATFILKKWHSANVHLREVKADYRRAEKAGVDPAILKVQKDKIAHADTMLRLARDGFRTASAGGDLDAIAQGKYGSYPQLGQAVEAGVAISTIIALVVIAIIVIAAAVFIFGLVKLAKEAPVLAGGIVLALLVAVGYFLFGKK